MMGIFPVFIGELLWEGLHCRCELWSLCDTDRTRWWIVLRGTRLEN